MNDINESFSNLCLSDNKKAGMIKKHRNFIENLRDGFVIVNTGLQIMFVNQAFASMLKYNKEDIIGNSLLEFTAHSSDQIALLTGIERRKKQLQDIYDINFLTKDGLIIPANVNPTPNIDEEGKVIGSFAVIKDLTELIRSRKRAEEANQAKTNFITNITHDIRTPLIGVMGAVDLLKQEILNSNQSNLVNTIEQSGRQLLDLINNILDLSKIEAGHILGDMKEFNLTHLIAECIQTVRAYTKTESIDIFVNVKPHVPILLIGYPLQIRRILLNLISNAVKHTTEGYIKIEIDMQKNYPDRNNKHIGIRFSVEDSGSGIPADKLNSLFLAFQQLNTSIYDGTGLGLSICKELVEKMGGQIWATSQIGKGSIFGFFLPLEESNSILLPKNDIHYLAPTVATNAFREKTILVVDDNELNCKIFAQMLVNLGCNVATAKNGHECLVILEEKPFDLILMDIQMPVMNGYETTKKIRQDKKYSSIPVVALTALALKDDVNKCMEAGCDYYLAKPVSSEDLYLMFNNVFKNECTNNDIVYNSLIDPILDDLMPEFITATSNHLNDMQNAINENNYLKIAAIAHDLKGSCGMFGLTDVSTTASTVYSYAIQEDLNNLSLAYTLLKKTFLAQTEKSLVN